MEKFRHLKEDLRFKNLMITFRSSLQKLKVMSLRIVKSRRVQYGAGGVLLLFLAMNYVVMPWYVYHGGTLNVPNVVGKSSDEAQNLLENAGLVAIFSDSVLDNTFTPGSVVAQNPRSNAVVKFGRHVYLTICGGGVNVNVPQLRGRSLRDAKFALERNGLLLGEVEYAASDSSPVNTIISQTVAAAMKVKKGSAIGLTVSSGNEPTSIDVPDLTGKALTEAEKVLTRSGLRLGNVTEQVNNDLLPHTVVDQFPKPGSAVQPGASIDVFVVKAGKVLEEH